VPEDGLRGLETQLGARPPAGFARLDAEHQRDLLAAVEDARRRQAAELEAASEQALRHIPKLLRGPIRRVIG
jgi:hypothetical protein